MRWIAIVAVAPVLLAGAVAADPTSARAAARAGEELGKNGDYVGAAAKFREAFQLDPEPAFLCNIGVAYNNADDLPRAHFYLRDCIERAKLEAALLDPLRAALASIEQRLAAGDFAQLQIAVDPASATITVDGTESFTGGRELWIAAGSHAIEATAPGRTSRRETVDGARGKRIPVALILAPVTASPPPRPPPPTVPIARPSRAPAIAATIATGVLTAGAVFTYLKATDLAGDTGDPTLSRPAYDDLVARARDRQHLSWLLGGLAGAGAIASGYLWYRASARVEVTPAGAVVSLAGRW